MRTCHRCMLAEQCSNVADRPLAIAASWWVYSLPNVFQGLTRFKDLLVPLISEQGFRQHLTIEIQRSNNGSLLAMTSSLSFWAFSWRSFLIWQIHSLPVSCLTFLVLFFVDFYQTSSLLFHLLLPICSYLQQSLMLVTIPDIFRLHKDRHRHSNMENHGMLMKYHHAFYLFAKFLPSKPPLQFEMYLFLTLSKALEPKTKYWLWPLTLT